MEKYYTPQINEFHVGFECEYNSPLTGAWEKTIYTEGMFFGGKRGLTQLEKRVKYLDREDIESCGWEHKQFVLDTTIVYNYKRGEIWLNYWVGERGLGIYIEIWADDTDIAFTGFIKNKSELKKLMIQLGIK